MSTEKKLLRNVHNGRLFPYTEKLAEMAHMVLHTANHYAQPGILPPNAPASDVAAAETLSKSLRLEPAEDAEYEFTPGMELSALHWTKLKALVEEHGGTYATKADALAFLADKGVGQ